VAENLRQRITAPFLRTCNPVKTRKNENHEVYCNKQPTLIVVFGCKQNNLGDFTSVDRAQLLVLAIILDFGGNRSLGFQVFTIDIRLKVLDRADASHCLALPRVWSIVRHISRQSVLSLSSERSYKYGILPPLHRDA